MQDSFCASVHPKVQKAKRQFWYRVARMLGRVNLLMCLSVLQSSGLTVMKQSVENETSAFAVKSMEKRISAMTGSHQQSHDCHYNIDCLKKGPVNWSKIERTGKLFTDHSFPADQTM